MSKNVIRRQKEIKVRMTRAREWEGGEVEDSKGEDEEVKPESQALG